MAPEYDLTTLDGLLAAVAAFHEEQKRRLPPVTLSGGSAPTATGPDDGELVGEFTGTYCTRCGGSRRMRLHARNDRCGNLAPSELEQTRITLEEIAPGKDPLSFSIGVVPPVFSAECLQCRSTIALIVAAGPPAEVIVIGGRSAGLSTPHTPAAVAFYLEQAYRSRTAGAYTAATAMYRAALEQFLRDQGYSSGTLAARIGAAVAAAPSWVQQLDPELMHALRTVGNWAVHLPGGDLASQAKLDQQLAQDAEHLLMDVLDEVYELPARRAERRARMLQARGRGGGQADSTAR